MKAIKNIFQFLSVSTAAAILNCSIPSLAANTNVIVGPDTNNVEIFSFAPAVVKINVGDSVIWTWQSTTHSTTSTNAPTPLWDSGVHNNPFSYTNKFNSVGSFGYLCTVHRFTGTVMVQAVDVAPTVNITSPLNSAVFSEPASVNIQATASDPNSGGTITNVQFLVGPTTLTNETAAPFAAATDSLTAGSYTLSAVAADNFGLTATNAITISVVTPVPLALATATQL